MHHKAIRMNIPVPFDTGIGACIPRVDRLCHSTDDAVLARS